jgi:dTDP-4-dehydrorhamnose 3,5-epimerase
VKVLETNLDGVLLLEPRVFRDQRGWFMETYRTQRYADIGIPGPFVQDNVSWSTRGILRGLHYQLRKPQGKLVMVVKGTVYDVAVDIRRGSPTFGRWYGAELSDENLCQLYIPPGFAHGFCVLSEEAGFLYKCTEAYAPEDERGIVWNDPELAIPWPVKEPILSPKDRAYKTLAEMTLDLPQYKSRS